MGLTPDVLSLLQSHEFQTVPVRQASVKDTYRKLTRAPGESNYNCALKPSTRSTIPISIIP